MRKVIKIKKEIDYSDLELIDDYVYATELTSKGEMTIAFNVGEQGYVLPKETLKDMLWWAEQRESK